MKSKLTFWIFLWFKDSKNAKEFVYWIYFTNIIVLRLLIWSNIIPISQCPYCPNAYHQNETGKFKKHLFNHEHVTKTALPHECIQCGKQDFCLQRLQKHIDNFRGPCHNNQCTQCHDFFKSHQEYKVSFCILKNQLFLVPFR